MRLPKSKQPKHFNPRKVMPIVTPGHFRVKLYRKLHELFGTPDTPYPIGRDSIGRILRGEQRATPEQAVMLEPAIRELGYAISKYDMVFSFKRGRELLMLDRSIYKAMHDGTE